MNLRATMMATVAAAALSGTSFAQSTGIADKNASSGADKLQNDSRMLTSPPLDVATVDKMIAGWPERPRLAAIQMKAKYGVPQEASAEQLTWRNKGRYKRIVVTRLEVPHDFPKPHMDYLAHTIDYRVPANKAAALIDYDGSVLIDRTAGEMSARCDLEGHNILTLNLAHDIITGKTSPEAARKAFGQYVVEDVTGKNPAYVMELQFQAPAKPYADPGQPVIAGAPVRANPNADGGKAATGDAEVLGYLVAINENEILAAAETMKKKVSPQVMDYAKMMQKHHGQNLVDTMTLAQTSKLTAVETPAVDKLRVKGAGELAQLIPLEGEKFGMAYMKAMAKGHQEVLSMIDSQLMGATTNPALKKHLTATRTTVAAHLEAAKKFEGAGIGGSGPSMEP